MAENDVISILLEVLAFFMLCMALMAGTARTVMHMIPYYQLQSSALALITLITAFQIDVTNPLARTMVVLFAVIPLMLLIYIEPLLALATVPEDRPPLAHLSSALQAKNLQRICKQAYPIWLAQRPNPRPALAMVIMDILLVVLAFIVAFSLVDSPFTANVLAISLSLLLIGLSIMRSKQDIISQIMGLLIMEHGMFLAAIRLIDTPIMVVKFIISLFLYIIITLTILLLLLPDLHQASGTIDVDQQDQLKG